MVHARFAAYVVSRALSSALRSPSTRSRGTLNTARTAVSRMKPESDKAAAAAVEKQRRRRSRGEEEQRSGGSGEVRYLGVRKRQWGKWVSEIRLPRSRERIWLGSYDAPEKAARAFDAAAFCLRGAAARLNFPDQLPAEFTTAAASHEQIQAAAARHASNQPPPVMEETSPASPVLVGEEFSFAHDDFWCELYPVAAGNQCRERPAAAVAEDLEATPDNQEKPATEKSMEVRNDFYPFAYENFFSDEFFPVAAGNQCRERPAAAVAEDLEGTPDNQEKPAPEKSMEVRDDFYPIACEDFFSDELFPLPPPPPPAAADCYEDRIEIFDEFPTLWSF
ncbi:ethylene-responsive transcription factor ERF034-like [Zingiber officinale]|uniref:ethylene-responsive transcription factor ERF034-like n=1 Tax=Zingiber officinale TaxID=94328 RepID=UPI001C4AC88A|nr:ethylene-responsive transcription factor ERF034-like [Zingiber officinale]